MAFRLLAFAMFFSILCSSAQSQPHEHTLDYAVHQYEQATRTFIDQALRKRANCTTQFKVQLNSVGNVLAMTIDGSECKPAEQKKLSKQIMKLTFPRFNDQFLHHSRGKLPVMLIKLTPGEQTRVQCLWGAE
jgi:hypothetical protein